MNKTKYAENYIRNKILSGEWKVGYVLPNTVDLSKEIGVSKFTLSEAFKPLVDQGIITRKTKTGTIVSAICSKREGTILTIGSARHTSDYAGGYLEAAIMTKSQEYLEKKDFNFKLATGVGKTLDAFMDSMSVLNDTALLNRTIGVLNTLGWFPLKEFERRKIPTVSLSTFVNPGRNEVIIDVCSVFRQCVDILLSHKAKKICIINMDFTSHSLLENDISIKKDNQIKDTLEDIKNTYKNIDIINLDAGKTIYGDVYDTFKNYYKENPNLDALFIGDDSVLPEIHRVILDLGIKIPEDMKIICWANKNRNYGFPLTWTRFELDIDLVVDKMYNILINKIDGIGEEEHLLIESKIIIGDSL